MATCIILSTKELDDASEQYDHEFEIQDLNSDSSTGAEIGRYLDPVIRCHGTSSNGFIRLELDIVFSPEEDIKARITLVCLAAYIRELVKRLSL